MYSLRISTYLPCVSCLWCGDSAVPGDNVVAWVIHRDINMQQLGCYASRQHCIASTTSYCWWGHGWRIGRYDWCKVKYLDMLLLTLTDVSIPYLPACFQRGQSLSFLSHTKSYDLFSEMKEINRLVTGDWGGKSPEQQQGQKLPCHWFRCPLSAG